MKIKIILALLALAPLSLKAQDCNTFTTPYSQDFETATIPALPACTTVASTGAGANWVSVNNPGSGFTNKAAFSSATATSWLFTRGVQLNAGSHYKISYKYGNNNATAVASLQVNYGTSPTTAAATTSFQNHDAVTGAAVQTNTVNYFSIPVSGVYYFGFKAGNVTGQSGVYVDDIVIEPMTCGIPVNLRISDLTPTSTTISWDAPTGGNSPMVSVYQYAIGTAATPPADGTYSPALTFNANSLTPSTNYYVFARTLCGPVWSDWTAAVQFTTPTCAPTIVPYNENFESATLPAIPQCTSTRAAANNWATVNNPGNGFTNKTLQYTGNGTTADAWFFTRGIDLVAGTRYVLSYKYGNNSTTTTEHLDVTYGFSPSPYSVNANVANHPAITGGTVVNSSIDFFTVPASGTYYFGFHAMSNASQGNLYLDDFSIEEPVCGTPANTTISAITDTSATVTWGVPTGGNVTTISVYQYAYSTTNTPPADGTFSPQLTVDLTELEPSTTYFVFTRTLCGPIWSEWTSTSFTTDDVMGMAKNTLSGLNVYPNPVKDIVTINSALVIDTAMVYNSTGQLIHKQAIGSQHGEINLQQFASGVYLVTLSSAEGTKRVKIIKQ